MQDDNPQMPTPYAATNEHASETIATAADDAKAAVQTAVHDATDRVKQVGADAMEKSADRVDAVTDGAAEALRQVSSQLKIAVDGLGGEQEWAGKAFQTGADGLDRVSDYLANGRFGDFTRDLQTFARSNPAAFLAGGVALGFLISRVGKTAAHHAAQTTEPRPEPGAEFDMPAMASPADGSALGMGGLS